MTALGTWTGLMWPGDAQPKSAHGMYVYDAKGREYLDFSSQNVYTNVGHQHRKVTDVVKDQLGCLSQMAAHTTRDMQDAASFMVRKIVGDAYTHVHFCTSGTDANENAIRIARTVTGRTKILSSYHSYHGSTGAALAASGDKRRNLAPQLPGHVHFHGPNLYRSPFLCLGEPDEANRAIHHLQCTIEAEGPETIAAILIEPIPGSAGILVPPLSYLARLCALAHHFDILVIFDEVMTGFGRTGYGCAFQRWAVEPDIVTLGKAMTSGVIPCGAVAVTEPIAEALGGKVPGGSTFTAHPLLLAATIATIDVLCRENLVRNALKRGDYMRGKLDALKRKHDIIGDVRGYGMFQCIDMVQDQATKEPIDVRVTRSLVEHMFEDGLLVFNAKNRIHLVPPLIATEADIDQAVRILDDALSSLTDQQR